MKTKLLLILLITTLSTKAQQADLHTIKNLLKDRRAPNAAHPPKPTNVSRNAQASFLLDYDGVDQQYASNNGHDYSGFLWGVNRNYTNTNNLTLKYAITSFDSLLYVNDFGNANKWIPRNAAQLRLDSFVMAFIHTHTTLNPDTVVFSVIQLSTLQVTGTGAASSHIGTTIWDTTIITNSSIPLNTTNYTFQSFAPNLLFNPGESFALRADFFGDTANKFNVIAGYRDGCAGACAAVPALAQGNSSYYLNFTTTGNVNMSGTTELWYDCDQNQAFTVNGCENFELQNLWFFAYVTADVQPGAAFPSDTMALCLGVSELSVNAYGQTEPTTYSWSPSTGLSSVTDQIVSVSGLVNPVRYTVTVTDANSATSTASVYVTPDQNSCEPVDTLSGVVYFDANNNGQKDGGELPMPNCLVTADNSSGQCDSLGAFKLIVYETGGFHTVHFQAYIPGAWFTTPANGIYSVASGPNRNNLNFGIHVSPDTNNVRVSLVNHSTPPRPGFNAEYLVYCENTMGNSFNGTVTFTYDSLQSYLSAVPVPDNVNAGTHTLSWNVQNLPGGTALAFNVQLSLSQFAQLNTILYERAQVIPDAGFRDIDSFDNTAILESVVVGSFDPNDKSVSPAGTSGLHAVLPGTELTYTIRFQNTGTFYAEIVSVADTLDTDLDMSTFRMINASHHYTYTMDNNIIIWRFANIMLPDSNVDEPGSHGFIQYKIKPKQSVANLSEIQNTAFIYFDFNPAVVTNTTSNLIDFYLGLSQLKADAIGVQVYPNPFNGQTNFLINSMQTDLILRITDVTGRVIDEIKNVPAPNYVYRTAIAKGIYNFDLRDASGIKSRGKLLIQ